MFLEVLPANTWVCCVLTNLAGQAIHADIVQYRHLTNFNGITVTDGYLTVIDKDTDWRKLVNRSLAAMTERGTPDLQWKIRDAMERIGKIEKGISRAVMCVETGQQWTSALTCARDAGLSYSQLLGHLNGRVGYKSVKKKTYKYC